MDPVFGTGGADVLAARFGLPLLARIPLDAAVRAQADAGVPIVVAAPSHPVSAAYRALAETVAADLARPVEAAHAGA